MKSDEAYVHQVILQVAKTLRAEGLSNADIFKLIMGELESWFMHISGLVGWWLI